ncbi:TIGR03086 family metal-binding protein [Catenuloplanes japonicus]|uniref:TIGR03086 family metal-binding protein n=1 Tax=Catenuloplanes japonicus TaxID=33876 RepID=UPI00052557AD|nr:TIGR03086 family metal-binding protein [Catenuloplanes japonicus]
MNTLIDPPFLWRDLLADAHSALRLVVKHVPVGGWDLPTPCGGWTVTQVLQHTTGDQASFAAAITGGPWPSEDPFTPSGHLVTDPMRVTLEAIARARAAFASVIDAEVAVPTPLPLGPMSPLLAGGACALDAAIHAWDIAVATHQPSPLTPETAHALLAVATEIVEPLRPFGAFAPPFDPLAEAMARGRAYTGDLPDDDASSLLRYLGRNPAWTP